MDLSEQQEVKAMIETARRADAEHAFGALFDRFRPDLGRRFERRLSRFPSLRRKNAVEDLLQDTAISALRGFRTFQGDNPELFHRWLTRIARTVFADSVRHARKKKRDIALENSQVLNPGAMEGESSMGVVNLEDTAGYLGAKREALPTVNAAKSERREILMEIMQELPPHYREVVTLRCIKCLTVDETAALMKIDRRYVEVMRLRATKKLGELLAAHGIVSASF